MLAMADKGNLARVKAALEGITGVVQTPTLSAPIASPDRYLVMARMNRELEAVDSFRRNGLRAYWPNYEELVVVRRVRGDAPTRRLRRVGIIPGYVFTEIDPARDLTLLLDRVVAALDVVRTFSGTPLVIADADIQIIRKIEVGLNTPRPDKVDHNFKVGEKVRFVDDLMGRWPPGKIIRLARDGRISVDVELMGRKVPVTVLPFQIERM